MKKTLWGIGGILTFLAIFIIPILWIYGGVWLYENFYSVIQSIALSLSIFVVLLSIFSLVPNLRLITGSCISISASILQIVLILTWLYTAYFFSGIIGVFLPPVPLFVLLFHGEFLILGELIAGVVLVYGFSMLGMWILTKHGSSKWLAEKAPSYLRYIIAVIIGVLAGQLLAMPIISALGSILGQETINSTTSLSFVNLSYMLLAGFVTGLFVGLIAGKRGKLLAGIAQFAPLIFLIIFSLIINRDVLSHLGPYGVSFWAWVGLLPALLGGHYGVKIINAETDSVDASIFMEDEFEKSVRDRLPDFDEEGLGGHEKKKEMAGETLGMGPYLSEKDLETRHIIFIHCEDEVCGFLVEFKYPNCTFFFCKEDKTGVNVDLNRISYKRVACKTHGEMERYDLLEEDNVCPICENTTLAIVSAGI